MRVPPGEAEERSSKNAARMQPLPATSLPSWERDSVALPGKGTSSFQQPVASSTKRGILGAFSPPQGTCPLHFPSFYSHGVNDPKPSSSHRQYRGEGPPKREAWLDAPPGLLNLSGASSSVSEGISKPGHMTVSFRALTTYSDNLWTLFFQPNSAFTQN